MAGSLYARARFMVGLVLRVASRALPRPKPAKAQGTENPETLIEAIMTGDLAALNAHGAGLAKGADAMGNPWFFIALESGSLDAVRWFLSHGASPTATDKGGRLPLEAVIQRATLADEFDDHLADLPAMSKALIAAGASAEARTLTGARLADLAAEADLSLV